MHLWNILNVLEQCSKSVYCVSRLFNYVGRNFILHQHNPVYPRSVPLWWNEVCENNLSSVASSSMSVSLWHQYFCWWLVYPKSLLTPSAGSAARTRTCTQRNARAHAHYSRRPLALRLSYANSPQPCLQGTSKRKPTPPPSLLLSRLTWQGLKEAELIWNVKFSGLWWQ